MAVAFRAINDDNFKDLKEGQAIRSNYLLQKELYNTLMECVSRLPYETGAAPSDKILSYLKNNLSNNALEKYYSYLNALRTGNISMIRRSITNLKKQLISPDNLTLGDDLDCIIGHIGGTSLHTSPFISLAPFMVVASEYAIPQGGRYNTCLHRKMIIGSEYNPCDTDKLDRKMNVTTLSNLVIELDKPGNLQKLVDKNIIIPKKFNGSKTERSNVNGFDNFASSVKEILFHRRINNIKYLINPFLSDLLYALGYSLDIIDKIFSDINGKNSIIELSYIKAYQSLSVEEQRIIDSLYNRDNFMSYNINDFTIDMHDYKTLSIISYNEYLSNRTIKLETIYNYLKSIKMKFLEILVDNLVNSGFCNKPSQIHLVDDEVFVLTNHKVNKGRYNDILIYQELISGTDNIYFFNNGKIFKDGIELCHDEQVRVKKLVKG